MRARITIQVQCIDVMRSRDNVLAKCTELVVIRARMSDLLCMVRMPRYACTSEVYTIVCLCVCVCSNKGSASTCKSST